MRRPPPRCNACQLNRVAWLKPRVDYCYAGLPGGPFTAPPCRNCGSNTYFSEGLCAQCHPGGPLCAGSCRGCLAWGVYRARSWHCCVCRCWRSHYPLGGGREIPLAGSVLVRLGAWLDQRARAWPGSINPHLFIGRRSAPRLVPVGRQFPWRNTNLRPRALREDRILQEIDATGGDIRRICDLFGLTVEAAVRYATTLDHPELKTPQAPVRPTQDSTWASHEHLRSGSCMYGLSSREPVAFDGHAGVGVDEPLFVGGEAVLHEEGALPDFPEGPAAAKLR